MGRAGRLTAFLILLGFIAMGASAQDRFLSGAPGRTDLGARFDATLSHELASVHRYDYLRDTYSLSSFYVLSPPASPPPLLLTLTAPMPAQNVARIPGPGGVGAAAATLALVPGQVCGAFTNSSHSLACTFPNPIGAGHFVQACAVQNSGSGANWGSEVWTGDTGTKVYDLGSAGVPVPFNTGYGGANCIHILSATGGGSSITVTINQNLDYGGITAAEFVNPTAADATQENCSVTCTQGSGSTVASAPVTPSNPTNNLVIGVFAGIGYTFTASGSYTILGTSGGLGGYAVSLEYQLQAASAPIAATGGTNSADHWLAHIFVVH